MAPSDCTIAKSLFNRLVLEKKMNEFVATVSSKNQVTLPSGVRKHLGIGVSDKVTFVVDDHGVHLKPARLTLMDLFGSVPGRPGDSPDLVREIDEAMDERAAEIVEKLRRP
jgi:AbrB family looped-hinge helix DNA binding protein